jgi:hypothetical protein
MWGALPDSGRRGRWAPFQLTGPYEGAQMRGTLFPMDWE